MSKTYKGFFEKVISKIVVECEKTRGILGKLKFIMMSFAESYSKVQLFTVMSQVVASKAPENPAFYSELAEILGDIITYEDDFYDLRAKLADFNTEEGKNLFSVLYPAMFFSFFMRESIIGVIVHHAQFYYAICHKNMNLLGF